MINLYDLFNQYKDVSIDILKAIDDRDYDLVNQLFDKRQSLIEDINNINQKEDINDIVNNLDILTLEEEIKNKLQSHHEEIKRNIKGVKEQKHINNVYNTKEPVDSIFVYKKF